MIREWIKASSVKLFLLVIGFAFLLGVYLGRRSATVTAPQQTVVHDVVKNDDHKVSRTVTNKTTTIHKPDGTLITISTKTENNSKENSKTADRSDVSVDTGPEQTKYSLGINYLPSITTLPSARDVEIEAGTRLGGSNFWLKSGFDVKHTQFKVGVFYEW